MSWLAIPIPTQTSLQKAPECLSDRLEGGYPSESAKIIRALLNGWLEQLNTRVVMMWHLPVKPIIALLHDVGAEALSSSRGKADIHPELDEVRLVPKAES